MGTGIPSSYESGGESELLVFELNDQRYGLSIDAVERVIRMVVNRRAAGFLPGRFRPR